MEVGTVPVTLMVASDREQARGAGRRAWQQGRGMAEGEMVGVVSWVEA